MEAPILNAFGVPAVVSDVFGAFEFLSEGEKYVRPRNFKAHCAEMKLDADAGALFKSLDIRKEGSFEFQDMEKVFSNKESWTVDQEEFFTALLSLEFMYDTGRPNKLSGTEISKLLRDTKAKWQARISALIEFVIKYTREGVNKETFDTEFRKIKKGWTLQLHDRRSAVVRVATIALSKLFQRRPRLMTKYSAYLAEGLFECVRTKVEVISLSGSHCVHSLVFCVPDPLKKLPIFTQLCVQARSKFIDSRKVAMTLITHKTDYYIEGKGTIVAQVWKKLNALLCHDKFGLRDADADLRQMSYGLMARAEMLKITGVNDSIRLILSGVPKKAYEDEKIRLQTEKQLPKRLGGDLVADGLAIPRVTSSSASPQMSPEFTSLSSNDMRLSSGYIDEYDIKESELKENIAETSNLTTKSSKSVNVHEDQAEILSGFDNPLPDPSESKKSQSIKKLIDKFSDIQDSKIDNLTIIKTLAIIRSGEMNEIDQNAVKEYLTLTGIPARVIEEAYSEYLEIHHMKDKLFERRPLGISVIIYKGNAVISSIQNPSFNDIQLGSRIIAINGQRMDNKGYSAMMKVLQNGKMPLKIRLKMRTAKLEEMKSSMDALGDAWRDDEVLDNEEALLEEMRKIMGGATKPIIESGLNGLSQGDLQAMKVMHKANAGPDSGFER